MRKWSLVFVVLAWSMSAPLAATGPVLGEERNQLQQVALTTRDFDRAIVFYRDELGLTLMFVANEMAFFDLSGTRLTIALDAARMEGRHQSILYFDVGDFEATLARLESSGIELEGSVETVQVTEAGALKLQQFLDPDGNALAIMGTVPQR